MTGWDLVLDGGRSTAASGWSEGLALRGGTRPPYPRRGCRVLSLAVAGPNTRGCEEARRGPSRQAHPNVRP